MAGKPRKDRSTIAAKHLGLRLTALEFGLLNALVEIQNARLQRQGLPPLMSQTSLVRLLIEREAVREELIVIAEDASTGARVVLEKEPSLDIARTYGGKVEKEPARIAAMVLDPPLRIRRERVTYAEDGKVVAKPKKKPGKKEGDR